MLLFGRFLRSFVLEIVVRRARGRGIGFVRFLLQNAFGTFSDLLRPERNERRVNDEEANELFLVQFFVLLEFRHFAFGHAVNIFLGLNVQPLFDHSTTLQLSKLKKISDDDEEKRREEKRRETWRPVVECIERLQGFCLPERFEMNKSSSRRYSWEWRSPREREREREKSFSEKKKRRSMLLLRDDERGFVVMSSVCL